MENEILRIFPFLRGFLKRSIPHLLQDDCVYTHCKSVLILNEQELIIAIYIYIYIHLYVYIYIYIYI